MLIHAVNLQEPVGSESIPAIRACVCRRPDRSASFSGIWHGAQDNVMAREVTAEPEEVLAVTLGREDNDYIPESSNPDDE